MPSVIEVDVDPKELASKISTEVVSDAIKDVVKSMSISLPDAAVQSIINTAVDEAKKHGGGASDPSKVAEALFSMLEDKIKAGGPTTATAAAIVSSAAKGTPSGDPITRALMKYAAPGLMKSHGKYFLSIKGGQGTSKTWTSRQFGQTAGFDEYIEVHCMEDMQASDFIGGPTVKGDGTSDFVFVDGPLATAYRKAAEGKTVFLLLDEIGLVPRKQKQAFLSATSPYIGKDGEEWLTLKTGRPIPTGKKDAHGIEIIEQEVIDCPMKNISIVGTQNVGAKYDCDTDTPAMKARFKSIYVKTDSTLIKRVVGDRLKVMGLSAAHAKTVTNKVVKLWKDAASAVKKSLLDEAPSLRNFMHAMDLLAGSGGVTDAADATACLNQIFNEEEFATWFVAEDIDGEPMQDQVDAWKSIVASSIK